MTSKADISTQRILDRADVSALDVTAPVIRMNAGKRQEAPRGYRRLSRLPG